MLTVHDLQREFTIQVDLRTTPPSPHSNVLREGSEARVRVDDFVRDVRGVRHWAAHVAEGWDAAAGGPFGSRGVGGVGRGHEVANPHEREARHSGRHLSRAENAQNALSAETHVPFDLFLGGGGGGCGYQRRCFDGFVTKATTYVRRSYIGWSSCAFDPSG